MSEEKGRVARYGLVQELHRFKESSLAPHGARDLEEFFCLQVEIVGSQIRGWPLVDCTLFLWRQLGLKLFGDFLRNLALDGEDIRQIAVVSLRPEMRVVPRIDQLRVHPHTIAGRAARCLRGRVRPELLRDLAQFARDPLLYCITLVRLITFRSAIFARFVRISSCTPSAK